MTSIILTPDTAPVSPEEGELYYDSATDKLKVRDASAFREVVSKNSSGEIDGTFAGVMSSSATGTFGGVDGATSTFSGAVGSSATIHNSALTTGLADGSITNTILRKIAIANSDNTSRLQLGVNNTMIASRTSSSDTTVPSFTAKQGFTYNITISFMMEAGSFATGTPAQERYGEFDLYVGTTSRSYGGTSFDTKIAGIISGADLGTTSVHGGAGAASPRYALVNFTGAFHQSGANATTYYYFTSKCTSTHRFVTTYQSDLFPMYERVEEIKGNVLTINT